MALQARLNRCYDLAALAAAALAAPIPYRHRWRALRLIARALMPVAEAIGRYRYGYTSAGLVTPEEDAFHYVLARATQLGLGFEPQVSHVDLAALDAALAADAPVVIIGIHAALLYLAGRYLLERGCDLTAVRGALNARVIGKPRDRYPYVSTEGPHGMLRLARSMTPGRVMTAMIDGQPAGRRTIPLSIGGTEVRIAYPLLSLALERGAAVVFFHPRLIGDRVEIRWRRLNDAGGVDEAVAAFGRFLSDQIGR